MALEFLKIALNEPKAYRSILGVTFTNKATEEMKSRIISVLLDLSNKSATPMSEELMDTLSIGADQLAERSRKLLSDILHDYSRFSIVTIDSFFHQVIRSFAREIGVQGSFNISLETHKVMQEVVDNLLADIDEEERSELRRWLTQFASNNVDEGKSWDFRKEVVKLSEELLKDHFKVFEDQLLDDNDQLKNYKALQEDLHARIQSFETHCIDIAKEGVQAVEGAGGVENFSRNMGGPAGVFYKVAAGAITLTDAQQNAVDDLSKWLTKKNIIIDSLRTAVEEQILPIYSKLVDFIVSNELVYHSLLEISRFFYAFGILSEVSRKLSAYRDENDLLLISDLPDFLRLIIRDSDTPFIYERVGSRYKHFLIDEFQDTSMFQWNNFKSLVKNATDSGFQSMVVGDIKQSIYRWRGGDSDLLQTSIVNDIGEYAVQEKELATNWRSDQLVVDFNNRIFGDLESTIEQSFEKLPDKYDHLKAYILQGYETVNQIPSRMNGQGHIKISYLDTDETHWKKKATRKSIEAVENIQRQGYTLRDIAILTRTQKEAREISDAFFAYKMSDEADPGLAYDVVSSESLYLFSSHAVRFIISMLKWLHNEADNVAMTEWLYEYQRYVKSDTARTDTSIFRSRESWKKQVPEEFTRFYERSKTLSIYELVEWLIRVFKLDALTDEFTYIQGFQDAILDYSKNHRGDISTFLIWWEDVRRDRSILISDQNNAVKVLTIHKSKGLEYPFVIIPFLSWSMDHEFGTREEILWKAGPPIEPFDQLPVVPVRYSKDLVKTFWSEDYWMERSKSFLDNLNLTYVAFTRAIHGLYAFGMAPNKSLNISNAGNLILSRIMTMDGWNETGNFFELGSVSSSTGQPDETNEYALDSYSSFSWRSKLSLQLKGSAELHEQTFRAQRWGIEFHRKLSRLKKVEDLPSIKDESLKRELKMIVSNELITPFFENVEEVKVEAPILLPEGKYKRIDRLIKKGDQWLVIDFKTGAKRKTDAHQMSTYLQILNEMGYSNLNGYLVYLDPVEVVDVPA